MIPYNKDDISRLLADLFHYPSLVEKLDEREYSPVDLTLAFLISGEHGLLIGKQTNAITQDEIEEIRKLARYLATGHFTRKLKLWDE